MNPNQRVILAALAMGLMPLEKDKSVEEKIDIDALKRAEENEYARKIHKNAIHRFTGDSEIGRQIRSQNQSQVKHTELTKSQKEWNDAIEVKKQLKRERKLNGTRY